MSWFRGWLGEKKTSFFLWLYLHSAIYQKFDNLIIQSSNGTIQIDHLVISRYGVFIIETKNYKGWIFGYKSQKQWKQILYKKKYFFQNPLRQVYRQKKVLTEILNVHESALHTIIYFIGDCKLKTPVPNNVMTSGLTRYIKGFDSQVFSQELVNEITSSLLKHLSEYSLTKRDHLRSLRKRHKSTTICPNCGSKLVVRQAKIGRNAGSKFLGCKRYPKCRFTKDI